MDETSDDIQRLQTLLDASIQQAGDFLRSSFEMPAHSLSARQIVRYWQGALTVALATVTPQGEPRVAPIGAMLIHGQIIIPTVKAAARTRHLLKHSAISLTHYQETGLAFIIHGHAEIIEADHPDFATYVQAQLAATGKSVRNWGEGVYLRVLPHAFYTYAREPETYPM